METMEIDQFHKNSPMTLPNKGIEFIIFVHSSIEKFEYYP